MSRWKPEEVARLRELHPRDWDVRMWRADVYGDDPWADAATLHASEREAPAQQPRAALVEEPLTPVSPPQAPSSAARGVAELGIVLLKVAVVVFLIYVAFGRSCVLQTPAGPAPIYGEPK